MWKSRTRRVHLMLAICLALSFLAGTGGSTRAAADPNDIQVVNSIFSGMASLKIAPPLQMAIWEADVLNCLNNFQLKKDDDPTSGPANICGIRVLPRGIIPLYNIAYVSQFSLPGTQRYTI